MADYEARSCYRERFRRVSQRNEAASEPYRLFGPIKSTLVLDWGIAFVLTCFFPRFNAMPLTSFFLYGLFLVHTLRLPLPPPPVPRSKNSSPPPPPARHCKPPTQGRRCNNNNNQAKNCARGDVHAALPHNSPKSHAGNQLQGTVPERRATTPPPPGTASGPGCNGTRGKEDPAGEAATGRAGPTSLVVWPTGTPASISFNVCEVDKMQHFSLTHFFKIYSGLCPKIDPVIKCIFLCDY